MVQLQDWNNLKCENCGAPAGHAFLECEDTKKYSDIFIESLLCYPCYDTEISRRAWVHRVDSDPGPEEKEVERKRLRYIEKQMQEVQKSIIGRFQQLIDQGPLSEVWCGAIAEWFESTKLTVFDAVDGLYPDSEHWWGCGEE